MSPGALRSLPLRSRLPRARMLALGSLLSALALTAALPAASSAVPASPAPVPASSATPPASSASPAPLLPAAPDKPSWVQALLPKAWQKNPPIDLTVVTEVTDAGKQFPPASPQRPAYYALSSAGFQQRGEPPAGEKTIKEEDIEPVVLRSLAENGYLPNRDPANIPSLLIVYGWGSHSALTESLSPDQVLRSVFDRAAVAGGDKFAKKLADVVAEADRLSSTLPPPSRVGEAPIMDPDFVAFINPVNQFKLADPKNDFLVNQAMGDLYFVVVSAYDFAAIQERRRVLLWRTRMTVAAQGVTQQQTLPTLVLSAAPHFGRETNGAEIVTRLTVPRGSVQLGDATVVPDSAPPATPAPVEKK